MMSSMRSSQPNEDSRSLHSNTEDSTSGEEDAKEVFAPRKKRGSHVSFLTAPSQSSHSRTISLKESSTPYSYIQNRSSVKRVTMESCTSEIETDTEIQKEQMAMLRERNLAVRTENKQKSAPKPSCSHRFLSHLPMTALCFLIFLVITGAGVGIGLVMEASRASEYEEDALDYAVETLQFFSDQLDNAILPLWGMAQFARHLDIFQVLPEKVGLVGRPGSLPLSLETYKRNVTGVCDDPELVDTFVDIASDLKTHAGMDGILVNIQLAPNGVICLLHPMNNTEDFDEGQFLDNTPAWGLDLLNDPAMKDAAQNGIKGTEVSVVGPVVLKQCPDCDPFFIARLPIQDPVNQIFVNGKGYSRWGFTTALIDWTRLVQESGVYEAAQRSGYEFQLTRTDRVLNEAELSFEENKVILAETDGHGYGRAGWACITTSMETANDVWEMNVSYDQSSLSRTTGLIIGACAVVAFFISVLIWIVLSQKHTHADIKAEYSAQEAKVDTERNMTAYFAHELRNPLSALDSALSSITTEDLPPSTKGLLDSMQLCSSFMSSIMNNLLDVRKIEEGKMKIRSRPFSLTGLVEDTHKMMRSAVRPGVQFLTSTHGVPKERDYVLGDAHRIQQILTNVVTNAIKYTLEGSINILVAWRKNLVEFEVIDTGPGIPKSEQERLFERFVQRGGAPGTGLGLNIAQQIVNMMQGTIRFESDPTIVPGTTCRISLPLLLSEQPEEAPTAPPVSAHPLEEVLRILIVDDIKMNRTMLSRRITKAIAPNAVITTAETGEEALVTCQETRFDIIICDQYMEEAGGVLVGTDAIIAMRRDKVDAYIIGCSGNDLDTDFYEAGADMVWGKPLPCNAEIIHQWRQGLSLRSSTSLRV